MDKKRVQELIRESLKNELSKPITESSPALKAAHLRNMKRKKSTQKGNGGIIVTGMIVGMAIGWSTGTTKGFADGMKLGILGGAGVAIAKTALGKGERKRIREQIKRGEGKIAAWKSDPVGNKKKIERMENNIQKWEDELADLVSSGEGKAGILRRGSDEDV
tara:strand:- start:6332 stop:6817 length:486 start_codon:yes stop_codon:yes gene_type:complete